MAREHARIWLDINADDDFESLPFDAQGFYTRVILTLNDLSYCGVALWRPRKLTTKAPDLTHDRILRAASALEGGRYCLFDLETEEVLARSYIRRDELLRNPKFAAAVIKAYGGIASKTLRAAVVTEIRRVHDEHPEYSSWTAKDKTTDIGAALSKIMGKAGLDELPYVDQIDPPITNGQTVDIGNTQSVHIGNPVGNGDSVRIPSTYTSTSTPSPLGGYVSTEGHQGERPQCIRHPHENSRESCPDCRTRREWDEAEAARIKADEISARRVRREAIDACDLCDRNGKREAGPNALADCTHPNSQEQAHA